VLWKVDATLSEIFEVFAAVKIQVEVFWVVTPCIEEHEVGGSMGL
jgi:hypothetical protein